MSTDYEGKYTTVESWHTLDDGVKVYIKTWKPTGPVKARLVLVHGFTDHCNNFRTLFPSLAAVGIQVHGWDQRGWGRSVKKPSDRGLTGHTKRVMDDITSVVSALLPCPEPLFLLGHSMGGAETLTYAATGPSEIRKQIRGYLIEAPLIGLSPKTKPLGITVAAGKIAGRLLPTFQLKRELDRYLLSHDRQLCEDYKNDPLVHNIGTLEGLAGMLERGDNLETGKIQIQDDGLVQSVWVAHGTADGITYEPATAKYVKECVHIKDKEYHGYDGWFHVMHGEAGDDKFKFAKDMADWILARA